MALTNYMTGSESSSMIGVGHDYLQLGVDGSYSFLMWGLAFVQANFVLILIGAAIGVIVYLAKKRFSANSSVAVLTSSSPFFPGLPLDPIDVDSPAIDWDVDTSYAYDDPNADDYDWADDTSFDTSESDLL